MARYTDIDNLIKIIQDQIIDTNPNDLGYKVLTQFIAALNHAPIADVAPRAEVAREIFEEIMRAMERGVAEADKAVINNTSILDFRESLCCAGEMYAGYIGVAICKVFQKYTEGQK